MEFKLYGKEKAPSLLLIPGLGVSFEIFLPLTELLKDRFHIITAGIDGFLTDKESCWMNAGKCGLPARARPSGTDTRTFIHIGLMLSTEPTSTIGMAPRRPL